MESQKSLKKKNRVPIRALIQVASVAAGVQFGWALQLSLLTPYVQELGIPHAWASFIWLCGPISGMIVQPIIGHYSDSCTSSFGRRRPFILGGAALVICAVLIIGFSADLGYLLGDSLDARPRAIVIFVIGFWVLDLANNTLQGPCRALLADFTGKDQTRNRRANAFFSLFMALGNILGFATGAYNGWYKIFPFTYTRGCDVACANLKSAFLLGVLMLMTTTFLSVTAASEVPYDPLTKKHPVVSSVTPLLSEKPTSSVATTEDDEDEDEDDEEPESEALFTELLGALRDLPRPMWYILLVTALTWIAWFPFLLFDTDWMGREVYNGEPSDPVKSLWYYDGVHMGSVGLMLQSVVLGLSSLCIEFLCRKLGSSYVWAIANVIMTLCFVATAVVSRAVIPNQEPATYIIYSCLAIFAILGAPLAVTYSVPYALTATYTEKVGGGQGLSVGVLNLAVVTPQVLVSVGSGPWDELFGGGNLPAFLLGAGAALLGAIAAVLLLPRPPPDFKTRNNLRRTHSSPIP
jgi:solute carrier family 45 protein 1/2/4